MPIRFKLLKFCGLGSFSYREREEETLRSTELDFI
jgi:hypothetical protein